MLESIQRHLDAIALGAITKTNIIGIRKALNEYSRRCNRWSVNRVVTAEEADAIMSAIYKHQPKVSGELHETGLKLLRDKRYKKRLAGVAHIIDDASTFHLVDFEEHDSAHFVPVYRLQSTGGAYFDFRNVPWQSGGNGPEIVTV